MLFRGRPPPRQGHNRAAAGALLLRLHDFFAEIFLFAEFFLVTRTQSLVVSQVEI
jgi:hypothetical protein